MLELQSRLRFSHIPWIVLFISLLSIHFKPDTGITELNLGNSIRIFTVGLAALISVFIIIGNKNGIRYLLSFPVICLLFYGIIGIISGSYATQGLYAIWKAIEVIVDVLAVVAVLSGTAQRQSVSGLYRVATAVFILLTISVVAGALIAPGRAFMPVRGALHIQLSGIMPPVNPNGVAFICAFIGLVAVSRFLHNSRVTHRILYACLFIVSFVSLVLAQSRTSLIGFVAAIVVFLIFDKRWISLGVILGIIICALSVDTTIHYLQREQSTGLAMSLSGRTSTWKASWQLFEKSPYIGNGFASAGRFDILKGGGTSTLHGSLFDVIAGVGLLGFIPWLMAIAYTGIRLVFPRGRPKNRARTPYERGLRAELIAIMVLVLFRVTTSSGLALHDYTFLIFVVLLAFSVIPEIDTYNESSEFTENFVHAYNPGT